LYRPPVTECPGPLDAPRSSSIRSEKAAPDSSSCCSSKAKQSNGALLRLTRRGPGGSHPFVPLLHRPAPTPTLPANSCRGSTPARRAMAPRPPLRLRFVLAFIASAGAGAGAGRGSRRLRGAGILLSPHEFGSPVRSSSLLPSDPAGLLLCLRLHFGKQSLTEPLGPRRCVK
jgi:hypothetical protein